MILMTYDEIKTEYEEQEKYKLIQDAKAEV